MWMTENDCLLVVWKGNDLNQLRGSITVYGYEKIPVSKKICENDVETYVIKKQKQKQKFGDWLCLKTIVFCFGGGGGF